MAIEPPVWKNGPDSYDLDKKNSMLYDALIRSHTVTRTENGTFELTLDGGIKAIALAKEQNLDMSQLTRVQVVSLVVYGDHTQVKEA